MCLYKPLRGGILKVCQEFKRNYRIPPLRVVRDIIVTIVFSSINISALLPVDVGTLTNHIKSCVPWLCGDYLLMVDLRFRFCCRVFDLVFLCSLIGNRSSTPLENYCNIFICIVFV